MTSPSVLVFARLPVPGEVKTRLIPALGPEGACAVYRRLLTYTLGQVGLLPWADRQLWLDGAEDLDWPEARAFACHRQRGADLGQRMGTAVQRALAGTGRGVVVVGSDCPQLAQPHYAQVARLLLQVDVVIIPALDGGYVLLGLRRYHPALFEGVAWGTSQVLAQTLRRVRRLGWRHHCLPPLADVDRPEDLVYLAALDAARGPDANR